MGIDYRRPFIPEKRLALEGYPFAQPISVSQKWSPLSVLLAHLMLSPFFLLVLRLTLISKFLTLLRLTVNSGPLRPSLHFMTGCLPAIKERLFPSHRNRAHIIKDIFEALCANISHDDGRIPFLKPRRGHVTPTREKNIYIEQCYICGITGYHNFLSLDRLSTFLGWQLPLGCYGENATNQGDMLQEDWNNREDSHQGLFDNVHSSGLSASKSRCQTNRDLSGNLSL